MSIDHSHDCQQKDRIIQIEKDVTEVKTEIKYYRTDLEKLEKEIKENTEAVKQNSLQLSEKSGSSGAYKWIISTFGLTILTIALTRLFN